MTAPASDGGLGHDVWSELAAGYALYALDAADEQAFRLHLQTCARCQQEVAAHLAVASHLVSTLSESSGPAPEMPLLLRREAGLVGGPRGRAVRARRDVARSRWAMPVAAAVVALVIGGGVGVSFGHGSTRSPSGTSQSAAVDAFAKGQVTHLTSVDGVSSAEVAVYEGKGYLNATGLSKVASKDQQYVAWITGSNGVAHAVAGFDGGSSVTLPLGETSSDVHAFAVSREKAGALPTKYSTLVLGSS